MPALAWKPGVLTIFPDHRLLEEQMSASQKWVSSPGARLLQHQGLPHPNLLIRSQDGLLICSSQGLVYTLWGGAYHPETADQAQVSQAGTVYQAGKLGAEWTNQCPVPEHIKATNCNSSSNSCLQPLSPHLAKGYSPLLLTLVRSKVNNKLLDHRTLLFKLRDY